jgi:hypothetical protein
MAVNTGNEMNIVSALRRLEGRIHLLDILTAIGKPWMTIRTGVPGIKRMHGMAGHAAQTFVYASRSSVVADARLLKGNIGVTLKADPLTGIGGNENRALTFREPGRRKKLNREVASFAPVVEADTGNS